MSAPRRLICLLALPLALVAMGACDEDDDPPPVQNPSAGSAGSSAGGAGNSIPEAGGTSQGTGGVFTGNGNNDGDNRPPTDPPVFDGPGGSGVGGSR